YDEVLEVLGGAGDLGALRRRLAGVAFSRTAAYDRAISGWLAGVPLRYGENPHQSAHFHPPPGEVPFVQHAGKELSYNNLLDLDAAGAGVWAGPGGELACGVVVKHGSPSGIAWAPSAPEAVRLAIAADPISAFGGIVALDRPLDLAS